MKRFHAVVLVMLLLFCMPGCQRSFDSQAWQNDSSSRKSLLKSAEGMLVPGTSRQQTRTWLGNLPNNGTNYDSYFIDVDFGDVVSYLRLDFDANDNLLRTEIVKVKAD